MWTRGLGQRTQFAFEKLTRQLSGAEMRRKGEWWPPRNCWGANGCDMGRLRPLAPLRPLKGSGETTVHLCPRKLLRGSLAMGQGGAAPSTGAVSGPGWEESALLLHVLYRQKAMTSLLRWKESHLLTYTSKILFDFYNLILEKGQQLVLEDDLTFTLLFGVKQPQMVTLGNDVNICA